MIESSHPAPCTPVQKIRALNDALRVSGRGGRVVITAGIAALPPDQIAMILTAVAMFDEFDESNDPQGEHDCASLTAAGEGVIWRIDYYDATLTAHSADPADPIATMRVLTIMRGDEY